MPRNRLTGRLRNPKVRGAGALAAAREAAGRKHTAVIGEKAMAKMVHILAQEVTTLKEKLTEIGELTETDNLIEGRFREHERAHVIPDRLAAFAGVAPAPRAAPGRPTESSTGPSNTRVGCGGCSSSPH